MTAWVKEIREDELVPVAMMAQGTWKRYVSVEVGHAHDEEELFYVLSGHGEATWEQDGETHRAELKPGVAFYKTSHVYHTMRNIGQEPLVGLAFKV
jgi:mannose-6-phosphate isomerase-like protein (cupin superfamily)